MSTEGAAPLGLRERKKLMTRQALLAAAEHLFEARGYDNVTVAQIADAANVSVKTLFTYFASKEDLAFGDEAMLRTALADAIRARPAGRGPLDATLATLGRWASEGDQAGAGLDGFRRGYGDAPALQNRLRRMWADYEDTLTEAILTSPRSTTPTPTPATARLQAMQMVLVVRFLTTPEVAAAVAEAEDQRRSLHQCLDRAAAVAAGAFTDS